MKRQLRQLFGVIGNSAVFLGTLTVISSTVIAGPERMVDRASAATPAAAGATRADCSKATATQLVSQHQMNDFLLADPVQQVLCGSFTGAGSEAMAVTIAAPTCWPTQRWAVFSFSGGAWQLVLDQREWIFSLVVVGNDLQVTSPAFRPDDGRCLPSGGKQSRVWHWDGSKFVAGSYTQLSSGDAKRHVFYWPGEGILCTVGDSGKYREAYCWTGSRKGSASAELSPAGRVKIIRCRGPRCVQCGCGPDVGVLAFGQQVTIGRFQCVSLKSGMKCTVAKTGKGFLINLRTVKRIG